MGSASVPTLSNIIRKSKDQLSVNLAIEALGKIKSPSGVPVLVDIFATKRKKFYPAAKKAIVMLPADEVIARLIKKMSKFDDSALLYVIDIFGTFKKPEPCPSLITLLKHKNNKIVKASQKALVNLAPKSIPFVAAGLNDYNLVYRKNWKIYL